MPGVSDGRPYTPTDAIADAAIPDAHPDAVLAPDAAPLGAIESCEDACSRLADCERLGGFGDEATCLERCARMEGSTEHWFGCLAAETQCALVHLCRPPPTPVLSCDAACAAVDACGVELSAAVCEAACRAVPDFARCGDRLTPHCAVDGFWGCVAERIEAPCRARCAVGEACGIDGPDCLARCVAAGLDADPLAAARHLERTRCVATTDDCTAATRCLDRAPEVIDRATFCAEWDRCADAIGLSCAEGWARGYDHPGYATCVVQTLRDGCPGEPFRLFERCVDWVDPHAPDCGTVCDLRALCGHLPEGERPLDCARRCNQALASGRAADAARVQRDLACADAADCDALVDCLHEADPATPCAAHCAALERCGAAAVDCAESCQQLFFRARRAAERACVAAAGDDCAAVSACVVEPPVGCDTICGRAEACGFAEMDCVLDCDDAHFADPEPTLARMACMSVAPLCSGEVGARGCVRLPGWTGGACLGWCRAGLGCVADEALERCVVECGHGLRGAEAAVFESARPCLTRLDPMGPCAPLQACSAEAPPVDCAAWCAALNGCGLAPEGCEAVCAGDALGSFRAAATAPCITAAADCDALGRCLHTADVFFSPAEQETLCARHRACGFEAEVPCDAYFRVFPDDIHFLRCLLDGLSPCPEMLDGPGGLLFECFARLGDGPDALPPCRALCRARQQCGAPVESVRECASACVDAVQRAPQGAEAVALACSTAWSCAELHACEGGGPP